MEREPTEPIFTKEEAEDAKRARIEGEWDNPNLEKIGLLTTSCACDCSFIDTLIKKNR